jgi:site-specific recombinase XerC
LAAKLEREAELKRAGVYDPFEQHRKRPLAEHLEDYERFLTAKGNSEKHVYRVISRARKIIESCGFAFACDLSPAKVQESLAGLRKNGSSAQTVNFYMQAMKQFATWMVRDRRIPDNLLCVLMPMNVQKDRRHDRRALAE